MTDQSNKWKMALQVGIPELALTAIRQGADVNDPAASLRGPPLVTAAMNGFEAMIEVLLKHGADPSAKGMYGADALFEAAAGGHYRACMSLLDAGADPNSRSYREATPLMGAAANDRGPICNLLVSRGAEVDACHPIHGTALCHALSNRKFGAAMRLVKLGADPNFMPDGANEVYRTPFMQAAAAGEATLLQAMIAGGAVDPFVRPAGGPSAAELARAHPKALELILGLQMELTVAASLGDATAPAARRNSPALGSL